MLRCARRAARGAKAGDAHAKRITLVLRPISRLRFIPSKTMLDAKLPGNPLWT